MSKPNYSLIIAAHNEGLCIGQLLTEICDAFVDIESYEVFVSEDGSRDDTREIVLRYRQSDPRIRLSDVSIRRGYSGAIQHGIQESRGNILIFLDGDGQTNPVDLVELISELKHEKQIVIGSRSPRLDSNVRKIQSKLFYFLYRILGFPRLKDPSSGSIICYRNSVLEIAEKEMALPFGFWWEFQAWAAKWGYEQIEIPITHRKRIAGQTQVYLSSKVIGLAATHITGLFTLKMRMIREG